METADGKVIVFADTEDNETGDAGPDGKADEAYIVDKQTGKVVGAAHIDPSSGTWVEGTDPDGPSAVGSGTARPAPARPAPARPAPARRRDAPARPPAGPSRQQSAGVVTVEYGGHQIGVEKTIDTDDDGVADSGVVYTDGKAVVLTDTGGDSGAEQATIVDPQTGQIVDVAHVDPQTGRVGGGTGRRGPARPGPGRRRRRPPATGTTGTEHRPGPPAPGRAAA